MIFLENRSIMQERYAKPSLVWIYVMSVHQTALGSLGEKSRLSIFLSSSEKFYSAFSGFEAFLMKLLRDLWRTIYAEAFIIYLADLRFDEFLLFAAIAGFAIKPVIITAFRNT